MDRGRARGVALETLRRARIERSLAPSMLFGPQRAFVEDNSRLKLAVCSRRAGKSFGITYDMIKTARRFPRSLVPYITTTRDQARRIIWPEILRMNEALGLGMEFNRQQLSAVLPNGSEIFLVGTDDEAAINKLRGPKYPKAYVDEAQAFRPFLKELILDVLYYATLDYKGQIIMTGTPNAAMTGYFYEASKPGSGWSVHHWTAFDNPHIPDIAEQLADHRKRMGWTEETPQYVREALGRWVRDGEGLVYQLNDDLNLHDALPDFDEGGWDFVLGIDVGFVDSTAAVVYAHRDEPSPDVWMVESWAQSGLIPSALAARVEAMRERYDFSRIVADTGGLGKGYAEEMKQRFQIPVEKAQKRDKLGFIELMNGDFRTGVLKIYRPGNRQLIDEMRLLQWDEDRKKPDERYQDHLCDAALYGWRETRAWAHEGVRVGKALDPRVVANAEADAEEERQALAMEREERDPWEMRGMPTGHGD